MAMTYSEVKTSLDEIGSRIASNRSRIAQARAAVTAAEADLAAMPAAYAATITDLAALLAAAPQNVALLNATAEKTLLVSDFQALRSVATALKNAMAGVS